MVRTKKMMTIGVDDQYTCGRGHDERHINNYDNGDDHGGRMFWQVDGGSSGVIVSFGSNVNEMM